MKNNKLMKWAAGITCCLFLTSCENPETEQDLFGRQFGFPAAHYNFENNPPSIQKIQLGRALFYDPILSSDSTISCGSCHAPEHAFADHGVQFSTGVNGKLGKRNSPSLANMKWNTSFAWDGGINHIEIQPVTPITDSLEMNETLSSVVNKLNNHNKYPALFKEAFGKEEINDQQLLLALTQFMSVLVSDQSKFDDCIKGKEKFTSQERKGYDLFDQHCTTCHEGFLFSNFSFQKNGFSATNPMDMGRHRITQKPEDKWKFKVPSLRNVALTYPYMHDGSVSSLEEVIALYSVNSNVGLKHLPDGGFNFSEQQQKDLIAFLKTLTDYKFTSNHDIGPNPAILHEN